MGAINDIFTQNTITFTQIEEIFKILLEQNVNKPKNKKALQEIGLLKEYSYIKSSNELTYFSKKNKIIKAFTNNSTIKKIFVEWTKILFDINKNDLESVQKFNNRIDNLKKNPLSKAFFQNNLKKYLFKNKLFNNLLNYGIPNNLRELVWEIAISEKYNGHKFFNYEEEQKEYNSYLKNVQSNSQIEKDLNRTIMNESEKTKQNLYILKNILNCINKYNDGYCQGMNFIVGFLLKITNYEEIKTFYIFKNILPEIKGYFEDDFPLLKKNISIFDEYFKKLYPKLYNHFKNNDVFNELWVGKWFQTLFTLSIPFEELCNIWDILIIKGFYYIIYIGLAFIGSIQNELLKLNDSSDILSFIKSTLNPKDVILIYKNQLEEEQNKNIIPLYEILSNSKKIEKLIQNMNYNNFTETRKSDNNLNNYSKILKKEKIEMSNDLNSSFNKKRDENSVNIKHSFSSKSSSTLSSSISINSDNNSNLINTSSLSSTQNSINKLKNNLYNNEFINKTTVRKSTFFSSKSLIPFTLYNENNLTQKNVRESLNIKNNNLNMNNLRNSYNLLKYPAQAGQCIYYNNMNYNIIYNRPHYKNTLIYYA